MKKHTLHTLAGFTFLVAAALHLSRFVTKADLAYGSYVIPLWFSVVVGLWAAFLSYKSFKS